MHQLGPLALHSMPKETIAWRQTRVHHMHEYLKPAVQPGTPRQAGRLMARIQALICGRPTRATPPRQAMAWLIAMAQTTVCPSSL